MSKTWFVWEDSNRGPVGVIYHVNPHERGPDSKALGPKILAVHELSVPIDHEEVNKGVFDRLAAEFPPPAMQD